MTACDTLIAYLDEHGIEYMIEEHALVFTAQEIAAAEHVPGRKFAKVVMVEADEQLTMLVLPASYRVDTDQVATMLGAHEVRLADEAEFGPAFADCDVGAMPPFGNLYRVPVYADESLAEDDRIVFQAGTHTTTLELSYDDYTRLVKPGTGVFAVSPRVHAQAGSGR